MTQTRHHITAFSAIFAAIFAASTGCENTSQTGAAWDNNNSNASTELSASDSNAAGDMVDFGSLNWSFGGVNGSGASHDSVQISGLKFSNSGLSFSYDTNLSAWGLSHDNAGALACLFVQKSDGSWVGGKFDWISSSRTTRGFAGHVPGYNGWVLTGVPNPCNAAFVIISANGRKRSNVISGTWSR